MKGLRALSSRWSETKELARFRLRRQSNDGTVGDTPHFESAEVTKWFLEQLDAATTYVEFGAGGSTYQAAARRKRFTTIDSDRSYLLRVKQKIISDGLYSGDDQRFVYRDIGPTIKWGKPAFDPPLSRKTLAKYSQYSEFPLDDDEAARGRVLVLVDGRFRVACALKAFRALRKHNDWCVIVDDYRERPFFHEIERLGVKGSTVGRMAAFERVQARSDSFIERLIARYEHDWR